MKKNKKDTFSKKVKVPKLTGEDGQKRSEGPYKDGKPDGLHVQWYENGKKRGEGTFKDGKVIDVIGEWNEDGSVKE